MVDKRLVERIHEIDANSFGNYPEDDILMEVYKVLEDVLPEPPGWTYKNNNILFSKPPNELSIFTEDHGLLYRFFDDDLCQTALYKGTDRSKHRFCRKEDLHLSPNRLLWASPIVNSSIYSYGPLGGEVRNNGLMVVESKYFDKRPSGIYLRKEGISAKETLVGVFKINIDTSKIIREPTGDY